MRLVAEGQGREVLESVGFKYIATEMLSGDVLIGGEESGVSASACTCPNGCPFAAMLVLEALVEGGLPLGARIDALRATVRASHYDRLDHAWRIWKPVGAWKHCWLKRPQEVASVVVQEVISTDGIKLRWGPATG